MDQALDVLWECWQAPVRHELPALFLLQGAGQLGLVLVETGDLDGAREVFREVSAVAAAAEEAWGKGAAGAIAVLRLAEARLTMVGDPAAAVPALRRAVQLAEAWGRATVMVAALTSLASAQWSVGDRAGARASLDQAAEAAEVGEARPLTVRQLSDLEARIGRGAVRTARVSGTLVEELTDREMAVLRALRGPLTAREIASELYLSINTVKGYTKSLYRKLAVDTRAQAVQRGHELGLI
jgi:LuxR family maltose regulon positive regulatory protein